MKKKLWNKDYIVLLQSHAVSTVGDLMYSVAIGYWVYQKTGSSTLMGIMSSISMFMTMFLSPFCGSIVDKCNRKWLIVGIDVLQGLLMLTVGILAYTDALNVPLVLIAATLAAFGSVFYSPATSTLMLDIIPRDDMVRGQSIHQGVISAINLVGTAFSGVMVAFFGVPLIVVINGLSNLYAAVSELFIHVPRTIQQGTQVTVKGILQDTKSAIKTVFADSLMRLFVPGALILNLLCAGAFSMLLPFCMEKGFTVEMAGYLGAVHTVAFLVGVVLLGSIKLKPKVRFWAMAIGFSMAEIFFIGAFLSTEFIPMCIFLFVGSFLNCIGNTIFGACMMLALPEENRSAILGFISAASTGGVALSTVIYGFLGDLFPLFLVCAVGSSLSIPLMLYLCFNSRMKNFILHHSQ